MDDRIKRWTPLRRYDPCASLERVRADIAIRSARGFRREILFLRTPKQKKARDVFQGCIFLCGWRKIYGEEFQLIADEPEASPVDVIGVLDEPTGSRYFPIQLKQLPTRA